VSWARGEKAHGYFLEAEVQSRVSRALTFHPSSISVSQCVLRPAPIKISDYDYTHPILSAFPLARLARKSPGAFHTALVCSLPIGASPEVYELADRARQDESDRDRRGNFLGRSKYREIGADRRRSARVR